MILLFEGHRYQKDLISPYLDGINLDGIKRGKDWMLYPMWGISLTQI